MAQNGWSSAQRFLDEHVQRGARDLPGLQRREQRILVHHAAARQIEQIAGRLHRGEHLRIDDAVRLRRVGREQHQEIEPAHRLLEFVAARTSRSKPGTLRTAEDDAFHLHAERLALGCEIGGDRADAEDARRSCR